MSKTDKTDPWFVKVKRGAEDHTGFPRFWVGEFRCGCTMCTNQFERREERRRDRRDGKRQCRDLDRT